MNNEGLTLLRPYYDPLLGQLVDIRERSFIRFVRESELPIVPIAFQGQQNLERGKGQYLHHVSKGVKEEEIAVTL
jgi:hypothetical protein